MNAPTAIKADVSEARTRKINAANDRIRKIETVEALLKTMKEETLGGLTSKWSRFHGYIAEYQLADALSDLFGCDDFEQIQETAAHELHSEHSYDIKEEHFLDKWGDPNGEYFALPRVTQGLA